jgi:hypothetical protein
MLHGQPLTLKVMPLDVLLEAPEGARSERRLITADMREPQAWNRLPSTRHAISYMHLKIDPLVMFA